MVFNLAFLLI